MSFICGNDDDKKNTLNTFSEKVHGVHFSAAKMEWFVIIPQMILIGNDENKYQALGNFSCLFYTSACLELEIALHIAQNREALILFYNMC